MEFPLSVLQTLKSWDLPSEVEKPAKKASVSVNKSKETPPTSPKRAKRHVNRKVVQETPTEPKRPPAPIKWRERQVTFTPGKKNWAYKRNYMATFIEADLISYVICEISESGNHKPVLSVDATQLNVEEVRALLEKHIRALAKGHELKLTDEEREHGTFNKEAINFIPYEETPPYVPPVETTPLDNANEEQRLRELLASRRSGA